MQPLLVGRAPGKIFQLGPAALAIDFGLRDQGYLFLNAEPNQPCLYLIRRRVRDLEKLGQPLTTFAQVLRKELAHTRLQSVEKDPSDRIVRFALPFGRAGHPIHRAQPAARFQKPVR